MSDTPPTKHLADPQTLARVTRLELRARQAVEGIVAGMHRSPHRGSSVEFAQHRNYVPGDEIRHVDWKVFARTDRYQIKQYEEETNLKATFILDTSASMDYKGARSPQTKREYAAVAAAALATLLLGQHDAVGLATFDSGIRHYVSPSSTAAHLRVLLEILCREGSEPRTDVAQTLHDLAERLHRRGLIVIFSDFFADAAAVVRGLRHFRHRHHEAILFHVLDGDEIEFPFRDASVFEGLEGEPPITIEPTGLRDDYLRAFNEHAEALRTGCRELSMDYVQLRTDRPVAEALSRYLAERAERS
jgi:uncharacterized protein (DUF58 family)